MVRKAGLVLPIPGQDVWSKLATAEALAEALGVDLDEPEIPTARNARASLAFDALEANLREE